MLNQRIARLEETAQRQRLAGVRAAGAEQADASPTDEPRRSPADARRSRSRRSARSSARRSPTTTARRSCSSAAAGTPTRGARSRQSYEADPSGDLADNALFWIGETYFAAKDYTNAVRFYQRVVSDYADQNKAPDALFKIALAQERTGDLALARRTLQQVIERYPYSSPRLQRESGAAADQVLSARTPNTVPPMA